ncbi:MAG: UDP-N-acetylmuramate--alanine ligase [Verrucomicrobia bacterium]|nr:UDP-N-acetylmuramate--alanine ligase [Verrucomicrobiota bacterium]
MIAGGHYHLTGVAGVGMSALAQALIAVGCRVSGSDRYCDKGQELDVVKKLRLAGVAFHPQDGSGITATTAGIVVSTAIEDDNSDIAAAKRQGVPVVHRAKMLAELVAGRSCVAVTGTSGKSTVTGMIGWILDHAGKDPFVVNGAPVLNWADDTRIGNVRAGKSDLCVVEADESDRSLLNFFPDWAVITNMSADHFSLDETVELFRKFKSQVKLGTVDALDTIPAVRGFSPQLLAGGSRFAYAGVEFELNVPGRHNAENALHAVLLCGKLGIPAKTISDALRRFKGIHRRLELVGSANGVTVVDDYAHNTAKIRAAWETLAPHHGSILAVWRPHGYKPLTMMMEDLVAMFQEVCRPQDLIAVLPVYDAGGTANRTVRSEQLVERLAAAGVKAVAVKDYDEAVAAVVSRITPGAIAVTMGARDPDLPKLARRIVEGVG